MSLLLLSIKPEFVRKIVSGEKKYEFRKRIFNNSVDTIVIYASSPTSMVVGDFTIGDILKDTPDKIWKRTKEQAGVSKEFYQSYFKGKDIAYAIEIKQFNSYAKPLKLADLGVTYPPQSFLYLN